MHRQFEELCALAATGQLSGDAMMLLDLHLKRCENCRAFLEAVVPLKAHVAPVLAASHACGYEPPDGIRERFLQRAASVGIVLRPGTVLSGSSGAQHSETGNARKTQPARDPLTRWLRNPLRFTVPVAASILCGFVGYQLAARKPAIPPKTVYVLPTSVPANPDVVDGSTKIEKLREENANSRAQLEKVTDDLERARREKRDLVLKLEDVAKELARNEQFHAKYQATTLQLQNADERINELLAEVATEHNRAASADAVLIAQQRAAEEANTKVATLENQVERFRDLSDRGPAAELIAARNLHIVDVYDSELNGSRSEAFGRVFYVEGKSLVFYAYDLPDKNKKVEFRVWGEQAGVKSVSINLGAMRNDSAGQSRWVLTCNEPKLLGKINAIYITSNISSRHSSDPHSPRMMYAFLGSANHP
jgi:hypothetical protein